ncbi:hypothetical protein GOP47_0000577, partial [Adiantum capillus-veneris]
VIFPTSYVKVSNSLHGDITASALPSLLCSLESQGLALEQLLSDINGAQGRPPLSWFISDAFMPWTAAVAHKLQLSWIVFWTTSATRLHIVAKVLDREEIDVEQLKHVQNFPGLPPEPSANMYELLSLKDPVGLTLLKARVEAIRKADIIILNTFDALEEEAIKEMMPKLPIRSLGPLSVFADAELVKALKADDECTSWLDMQEEHSVLYIAFGNKVVLQGKALEQLAIAIESSKMPFLWALSTGDERLPEGFIERTKARSKIMSWAPQKRVLKHWAVGAFFTHCGWNSVVEAVVEGVPMICWPTCTDQPTNKLLVERKWRIGSSIRPQVDTENIRQVIVDVMGNVSFRQRASLLGASALSAVRQGDTSYHNFSSLMEQLKGGYG